MKKKHKRPGRAKIKELTNRKRLKRPIYKHRGVAYSKIVDESQKAMKKYNQYNNLMNKLLRGKFDLKVDTFKLKGLIELDILIKKSFLSLLNHPHETVRKKVNIIKDLLSVIKTEFAKIR